MNGGAGETRQFRVSDGADSAEQIIELVRKKRNLF